MYSLKKSIFYTFITQFPTQILGIITGIFITRMLGPAGRGTYTMFLTDVDLCVTIFSFTITNALIYYFAIGTISRNKVFGVSLVITLLSTLLFVIITIFILFTGFRKYFFPKDYTTPLMIGWFLAATFMTMVSNLFSGIFQGYREFGVVNRIAIINSIFNAIIFSLLFAYHKITNQEILAETVLYYSLAALIINLFWWLFYLRRKHPELIPTFTGGIKTEMILVLRYLGLNHLSNIINFLNYRFSVWVIALYMDVKELGYFGLASGIAGILNLVTTPISSVILPYLAAEDTITRRTTFFRYARLNFTVVLSLGLIGFILAPVLIPFVYGKEFIPSVVLFQVSLVASLFIAQNKIIGSYNMSNNRQIINLMGTLMALILTIGLNFLLIPLLGTLGAAIANSIAYIGMFSFLYFNFSGESKTIFSNIFIITKADRIEFKTLHEGKIGNN